MRLGWLFAALLCLSNQANASIEQTLLECRGLTQDSQRLACYDQLAKRFQSSTATTTIAPVVAAKPAVKAPVPTPPVSAPVTKTAQAAKSQPTAEQQVEDFGIRYKEIEDEVTKIYLDVVKVKKDPRGLLKITFSNGQLWKQAEAKRFKLKAGDKAFIEKASLGSFLLGTDKRNATIRVKRLK
ncbi:hypothetical protein [Shewanella gelidii]|uniref:Uncharacterized protein n=1 Tax=Shewanella gelidii TaxID=1642821 RepID=A0A917JUY7_9GAMM|nr:hypothetical protein [Shewanella gelidii]MCL1098730.1 hypothetical protein [Shewanella gelidii]GGI88059.1 hypothetical protein GCM10009332_26770 [Shewanella gelidii]